jgi:hypothetical protein
MVFEEGLLRICVRILEFARMTLGSVYLHSVSESDCTFRELFRKDGTLSILSRVGEISMSPVFSLYHGNGLKVTAVNTESSLVFNEQHHNHYLIIPSSHPSQNTHTHTYPSRSKPPQAFFHPYQPSPSSDPRRPHASFRQ